MRSIRLFATTFVLAFSLQTAGCSMLGLDGSAPQRVATEAEQQQFEKAAAVAGRDPAAGRVALASFLEQYPDGTLSDDAARMLADLALADGDVDGAVSQLEYIARRHGSSDQAPEATLLLARLEIDRGRPERAQRALRKARFTRWPPEKQLEAFRLLVESADDHVERVYWLASVREAEVEQGNSEQVAATDRQIDSLIALMSTDDLDRTAEQLDRRIPAARVRVGLARLELEAGDLEAARRSLASARSLDLAPAYASQLDDVERELTLRERILSATDGLPTFRDVAALPPLEMGQARGTIGVVLPLTGDFAAYGQRCLRGILLATHIFDELGGVPIQPVDPGLEDRPGPAAVDAAPPGVAIPDIRVVVRDSAGDPERAAAAVRALADDPELVAIVGPLLAGASDAAAQAAESAGVPLITLATRDEIASGRDWVFRVRTTPRDEVRALLDYAVGELGARRFAVLYPANRYGRGTRDQFAKGVEERGGSVVALSSYDPEATDFAEPIRRMIGYPLLTDLEKKALKKRSDALHKLRRMDPEEAGEARRILMSKMGPEGVPLPPLVDFDVLFIPDAYENVVLIAPQLAFHGVTGVRLLGTGDWLDPELVRIARGHVRGAVIAAPFDPASRFEFVARFVEQYTGTFGVAPEVFAAHAYDAANLALVQLAAGRRDRDELRDAIVQTQGYPGASGILSFLPDGNAHKRPYLMSVRRNEFISLD